MLVLVALTAVVLHRYQAFRDEVADSPAKTPVQETSTTPEPAGTTTYVRVVAEGLKLRSGPSRSASILRELPAEESLEFIAEDGGWYHVTDAAGLEGWVAAGPQYSVKVDL